MHYVCWLCFFSSCNSSTDSHLTGTVSAGSTLPNTKITVTVADGSEVTFASEIKTNDAGEFEFSLPDSVEFPILLSVSNPFGGTLKNYAGEGGRVHINALTTAAVQEAMKDAAGLAEVTEAEILKVGNIITIGYLGEDAVFEDYYNNRDFTPGSDANTDELLNALAAILKTGTDAEGTDEAADPEADTGVTEKSLITRDRLMVAAANPYAVRAGYDILAKGGNAVDAAIAVQMVLNLVEPQSSGIGGGGFMLYWNNFNKELTSFDGRETAPQAADEYLFYGDDNKPMNFFDAYVGGLSVGTPGILRMMEKAHDQYGLLPWSDLFQSAIYLAENGFIVSNRLYQLLLSAGSLGSTAANAYFFPNGEPVEQGTLLKNPELAAVFQTIAANGADSFYTGEIAEQIIAAVHSADNPGLLEMSDLNAYEAVEREPVCVDYHGYRVCGMGPPTSGGMTVGQILSMIKFNSVTDLSETGMLDLDAVHVLAQASRLAFADRGVYMADSDFVDVPVEGLLDETYLAERASLISDTDMGSAEAGVVPVEVAYIGGETLAQPCTSHFSIIDGDGNAVSMTTSIEMGFGSNQMTNGFLLNNQLTDFSFAPTNADNQLVANRVQPGKRPRSSMSPTMVFDENGELAMVIGSPGGSRIIGYVVQTIIGVIDWSLDMQEAISMPHVVNRNGGTDLEQDTDAENLKDGLKQRGHSISIRGLNSGLHGIFINNGTLEGGADPRREGIALGD